MQDIKLDKRLKDEQKNYIQGAHTLVDFLRQSDHQWAYPESDTGCPF